MPNHILNKVTLIGDNLGKIVSELTSKETNFDFNQIVKMPETLADSDAWYEWRLDNWGTKWNSYDCDDWYISDKEAVIYFYTAWNPPSEALIVLSKKCPKITIRDEWADEYPDIETVGIDTYKHGRGYAYNYPTLNDAIDKWCELNDAPPEDAGYYKDETGNYIYDPEKFEV